MQHAERLFCLLVPVVTLSLLLVSWPPLASSSLDDQHVYYAYIPPSVVNLSKPIIPSGDLVVETIRNYTCSPSNLDIVGIEDGTSYQLYDLGTKALLRSGSLNKYEHVRIQFGSRKTSTEPFEVQGYYIKLVTDKPVSSLVSGGLFMEQGLAGTYGANDTVAEAFSSYVPSVDGGFIGREFIFMTFPTFWEPKLSINEMNRFNIFATEDSKVSIYDSGGNLLQQLDVAKLSMTRTLMLDVWQVYRIASTGNMMVYGTSMNSMVYVPSLTGGYIGRSFLATIAGNIWTGDYQSLIIVALQDSSVKLHDMRKPAGSAPDKMFELKQGEMVFNTSLQSSLAYMVESTGNITLLWGGNGQFWGATWTMGYVAPQNMANDIALLGAKPEQAVGFYAPSQAVIFATGDTEIEVNGIPRSMKKDDFISVSSGTYNVKPTSAPVIIEVLGNANVKVWTANVVEVHRGFENWGTYLVSPQSLYKSYPPVQQGGGIDIFLYAGVAGIAAVVVVVVVLLMRKRNKV